MADLRQANKLLAIGRRRSNATVVELDIARQKFWDAVDGMDGADDLMLISSDRESELLSLQAELLRIQAERDTYQAANVVLNRIQTTHQQEMDNEFEELLRENMRLRQECEQLRKELRFLTEVPRPPPVP